MFSNGEQSTEQKQVSKNRFCTPFSPPRPPRDTVGLRTRLHFLALVSTTAAHRLDLITLELCVLAVVRGLLAVVMLRKYDSRRLRQGPIPASSNFLSSSLKYRNLKIPASP